MKAIWYNADQKKYKYGEEEEFDKELHIASRPEEFTILMKFNKRSSKIGSEVLRQLNMLNKGSLPFFL